MKTSVLLNEIKAREVFSIASIFLQGLFPPIWRNHQFKFFQTHLCLPGRDISICAGVRTHSLQSWALCFSQKSPIAHRNHRHPATPLHASSSTGSPSWAYTGVCWESTIPSPITFSEVVYPDPDRNSWSTQPAFPSITQFSLLAQLTTYRLNCRTPNP